MAPEPKLDPEQKVVIKPDPDGIPAPRSPETSPAMDSKKSSTSSSSSSSENFDGAVELLVTSTAAAASDQPDTDEDEPMNVSGGSDQLSEVQASIDVVASSKGGVSDQELLNEKAKWKVLKAFAMDRFVSSLF